ncbi:hypothetical protein OIU79_016400 [Salix purpurea]|uniref:Uncharacterized protein n=1 Tax=Salix purpurea TaxID=77065 RepID=A0A9Q0PEA0_SALPP|nr:hypothetical protein OIU79_016400 [Salix purpurea]
MNPLQQHHKRTPSMFSSSLPSGLPLSSSFSPNTHIPHLSLINDTKRNQSSIMPNKLHKSWIINIHGLTEECLGCNVLVVLKERQILFTGHTSLIATELCNFHLQLFRGLKHH